MRQQSKVWGTSSGVSVSVLCLVMGCTPPLRTGSDAGADGGSTLTTTDAGVSRLSLLDAVWAGEKKGTYDHGQALVYAMYAVFRPSRLPTDLQSGDYDFTTPEMTAVMFELRELYPTLRPELQAAVDELSTRPTVENSFWSGHSTHKRTPDVWKTLLSADGNIRFLFKETETAAATTLLKEFDTRPTWTIAQTALETTACITDKNGVVGTVDFYIVPDGTLYELTERRPDVALNTLNGLTLKEAHSDFSNCPGSGGFVLISTAGTRPAASTRHELFHIFQAALATSIPNWMLESSATWFQHASYPEEDLEHARLSPHNCGWVSDPRENKSTSLTVGPLDVKGLTDRAYGNYLWFFYLLEGEGHAPANVIRQMIDGYGQKLRTVQVMRQTTHFAYDFLHFLLDNLNTRGFDKYRDHGQHIAEVVYVPQQLAFSVPMPDAPMEVPIEVEPLSGAYVDLTFGSVNTAIEYDFSQLLGSYSVAVIGQYADTSKDDRVYYGPFGCGSHPERGVT